MSDRDLMQQALDAMMTIRPYEVVDYDQLEASITALRQALDKEWVGLTYEEIQIVASKKWWDWEDSFDIEGFSRAIERVLKEKNHG
jgi:hypothetical protein